MKCFLGFYVACLATADLSVTFGSLEISIFPTVRVNLDQDVSSPFFPNDHYLSALTSITNFYTLGSNQIVGIYDKMDPSTKVQTFYNVSYGWSPAYKLIKMTVDKEEQLLILTAYNSSVVQHLVYNINQEGIISHFKTIGGDTYSSSPTIVQKIGDRILTYHPTTAGTDHIYAIDITNDNDLDVSVGLSNCKIIFTPDKRRALLWNSASIVYIFSTISLSPERQYTLSMTADTNSTNDIAFSADSTLAILQTDNIHPIKVIQLSTGATINNITATGTVYSAIFLESSNRFILVHQTGGSFVYDRNTGISSSFTGTISDDPLFVDTAASELFIVGSSSVQCYGINITVDNMTLSGHSTPAHITPQPSVSNDSQVPQRNFYVEVNYSQSVNKTLSNIILVMDSVDDTVQIIFSCLLSTPLAIYFFSNFNYFTLSSLYALLSVKLPKIVYSYLSVIFTSSQADILLQIGIAYSFPRFSEEKVDDTRSSYLGVTSDIFPPNLVTLLLIPINIAFFEFIILLAGKRAFKLFKVHKILNRERMGVYWGLTISSMIPLLLPWTYSLPRGFSSLSAVINCALQLLLLCLFTFLVIATFLRELKLVRQHSRNGCFKLALREWWSTYQTYVYSVSLLLSNPLYFITIVGLSNYFALYLSFSAEKRRVLAVLKALYPIIFHSCFIAFIVSSSHDVLMWSSLVCLGVFLFGSLHHLLQALVLFVYLICKTVKASCFQVQVQPVDNKDILKNCEGESHEKREKHLRIDDRQPKIMLRHQKNQDSNPTLTVPMIRKFNKKIRPFTNKKVLQTRDARLEARKQLAIVKPTTKTAR